MKSSLENLLSEQLQGLLLPPKEPSFLGFSWEMLTGFSLLLSLLAVIIWRWLRYRNTPLEIAKREIKTLRVQTDNDSAKPQKTSIQLVKILRQGLGITRLDEYKPEDMSAWNTFQSQLNSVCYSTTEPTDITLTALFEESLKWLSRDVTQQSNQR